jgi:hypothetical protein
MKSRNSELTARQRTTSRAGRKDRVCALSSSGRDENLNGWIVPVLESGVEDADGIGWIGNTRSSGLGPSDGDGGVGAALALG